MRIRFNVRSLANKKKRNTSGEISQVSETPYSIEFSKKALDKSSVEYQTLRNDVKKVLGVIIGLIKDRTCVENSSSSTVGGLK